MCVSIDQECRVWVDGHTQLVPFVYDLFLVCITSGLAIGMNQVQQAAFHHLRAVNHQVAMSFWCGTLPHLHSCTRPLDRFGPIGKCDHNLFALIRFVRFVGAVPTRYLHLRHSHSCVSSLMCHISLNCTRSLA